MDSKFTHADRTTYTDTEAPAAEQQLWQAVLLQAMSDAMGNTMPLSPPQKKVAIAEARSWFDHANVDFREVCAAAGFDPERVRRYALKLIAEADQRRKTYGSSTRGLLLGQVPPRKFGRRVTRANNDRAAPPTPLPASTGLAAQRTQQEQSDCGIRTVTL